MQHYEVKTSSPDLPEKGLPTLYEWAGGETAIAAFINAFYDRVERDDLLAPLFPGGVRADHREHVSAWWSEVLGGPQAYTPLGGYARMLAHHLGLNVTVEQRRRFVYLISVAADDADLPETPSFGRPSSATPSGPPDWPCTTPRPAPTWCARPRCRTGAGASRRPTWADPRPALVF